ncbi:Telomerase reverse transcriptase [Oleoguttula sp. CCFEE 5521]
MGKRKRGRAAGSEPSSKRQCSTRTEIGAVRDPNHPTKPLLAQYYGEVHNLRTYLVSRLPKSSKKRRRRVLQYGREDAPSSASVVDTELARLLDTIIVGTSDHVAIATHADVENDISVFTQQLTETDISVLSNTGSLQQSEIVDLTVWRLFKRDNGGRRPAHLLCLGFQRSPLAANGDEVPAAAGIPGVELLMDCGLFSPVNGSSNVLQICGTPMNDIKINPSIAMFHPTGLLVPAEHGQGRVVSSIGLTEIRFLRHRMLYAKASLKASGRVRYGLSHAHVFSRCRNVGSQPELVHIMQHIFPRQFGLHNVFTSTTDRMETAQQFRDYTNREEEIARLLVQRHLGYTAGSHTNVKCPHRLRGAASSLVRSIRERHNRCSYKALLDHHCPSAVVDDAANLGSLAQASRSQQVAAFCKAVVQRVFPARSFGREDWRTGNADLVLKHVDRFVRLGRYETQGLHDVVQGLRIQDIEWLLPPGVDPSIKLSHTDWTKRTELLVELMYYLFDSFLIPLIRSHFHVTEAAGQRNELCFFRHDVWKRLSEPALAQLKLTMLEECSAKQTSAALAQRALGVSTVRLLPKDQSMRPIINLRRRMQRIQKGKLVRGRSINSVLTPAFSVLNYEKANHPDVLTSALFSVDDMYAQLQGFRARLDAKGMASASLYFAKVDVKACFDTIPQRRLMQLATDLFSHESYHITKFARATLVGGHDKNTPGFAAKPSWKFLNRASGNDDVVDLDGVVESDVAIGHARTAYVHGAQARVERRTEIISLLREHVESNVIKLGNRYYRQKEGIAQGSIVSSLLCSYFYGELEQRCLGFVRDSQSLLLRLIDDFLVITTDLGVAQRFMQVMHGGLPEFGVQVKIEKSRANFGIMVEGKQIPQMPQSSDFPYCGLTINTSTLDLSKDIERRRNAKLDRSVTVEYSKIPGQAFYRKSLSTLKLQMRTMLLSTSYNSIDTVLVNLYHCFSEAAQKMLHYIRALPMVKQPPEKLVIKTVDDLIDLACILMKRRKPSAKDIIPYECAVTLAQARWLACDAFLAVFAKRQTKCAALVAWLREQDERIGRVVQAPEKLRGAVERYRR